MKKTILMAMLNLLVAVPAFAQAPAQKLGLEPAAQAKLQQTFEKYRAQLEPLRQDARDARHALKAELESAQPNESHVASLTGQLQTDRQQMMTIAQQRSAELKQQLTPSQYAKLMLARHRFGRGQHHNKGGEKNG